MMNVDAVRAAVRGGKPRDIALVVMKDHDVVFRASSRRRALANYLTRSNRSRDDYGKAERECKTVHRGILRKPGRQTKRIGDVPSATCYPAFAAVLAAFPPASPLHGRLLSKRSCLKRAARRRR